MWFEVCEFSRSRGASQDEPGNHSVPPSSPGLMLELSAFERDGVQDRLFVAVPTTSEASLFRWHFEPFFCEPMSGIVLYHRMVRGSTATSGLRVERSMGEESCIGVVERRIVTDKLFPPLSTLPYFPDIGHRHIGARVCRERERERDFTQ